MLKQKVEQFKSMTPVVVALRNDALKPHHWEQIEIAIGSTIDRGDNFTLGYLLELKVLTTFPWLHMPWTLSARLRAPR